MGAQVTQFFYTGRGVKKKNWALENIPFRNEWVFILDADERVSPELAKEIPPLIADGKFDGFYVNREYMFLGRNLRCFKPNWNLRLFRHHLGRYELLATNTPHTGDNEIHEHVLLDGRVGHLRSSITNDDRRPLRAWVQNHNRYSDWEAEVYRQFLAEPLKPSAIFSSEPVWRRRALKRIWLRLPFRPLARFLIFYVARRGFLDGRPGFIYAALMAYYEFMTSVKLYEARLRS
jgi:hypothetical protein